MPSARTDYSGCTFFEKSDNVFFPVENGRRKTAYQPETYQHRIYLLGTCVCIGYAAPWDKTLGSYLQKIINDHAEGYRVENIAQFYNGRYQDALYNLNAVEARPGDIILVCLDNMVLRDIPAFYARKLFQRPHEYGEVYLDKYHINERGYRIVAEKIYEFLCDNNWFDDYDYQIDNIILKPGCPHMYGIPEWTNDSSYREELLEGLAEYKQMLRNSQMPVNGEVGAIVMNCNPFTKGHLYLIQAAASQVSHLYIFVVEEDKSVFPFADRIDLVRKGIAGIENVTVLPGGKFIISSLTFSEYFNKAALQDTVVDAGMDVEIFAEQIAPELGITVRFAGEEPLDAVTLQYNETMKRILPQYGIRFVEFPRRQIGGSVVSASRVRALIDKKQYDEIRAIVPDSTFEYIIQKYVHNVKPQKDAVDVLKGVYDLEAYLNILSQWLEDIDIFIVSKDSHTARVLNETTHKLSALKRIGLTIEIEKMYRWSFLAVIESGVVKKCLTSENQRLCYLYEAGNDRVMLISEGYNVKDSDICDGKIIINKTQTSVDGRGLNIVVWNKKANELLDSVCFDLLENGKGVHR